MRYSSSTIWVFSPFLVYEVPRVLAWHAVSNEEIFVECIDGFMDKPVSQTTQISDCKPKTHLTLCWESEAHPDCQVALMITLITKVNTVF